MAFFKRVDCGELNKANKCVFLSRNEQSIQSAVKGLFIWLAIPSCKEMFAPTVSLLWLVSSMCYEITTLSNAFDMRDWIIKDFVLLL